MVGSGPLGSTPLASSGDQAIFDGDVFDPALFDTGTPLDIASADWTGVERRLAAEPGAVIRVQVAITELEAAVDAAGLTNNEKARVQAMTGAILKLVHSPQPEWKIVAELLVRLLNAPELKAALNASTIATLIGAALKLIGAW